MESDSILLAVFTFPLLSFEGTSASNITSAAKEELAEPAKQEDISLTPTENKKREGESELSLLPSPDSSRPAVSPAGSKSSPAAEFALALQRPPRPDCSPFAFRAA